MRTNESAWVNMKKIELKELLKAGLHLGHRPQAGNPKMKPYIFVTKQGVHIFDLEKTAEHLEKAALFVKEVVKKGGVVLFVGTRPQAKEIIKKYALSVNMPYVIEKWLGGTLTNFKVINNLVKKLEELIKQSKSDDYEKKYTKKERHIFGQEMRKLEKNVGGIFQMNKLPDAIYISSTRDEKTALREALRKKIPIIGVCDSDANPQDINYIIPANDDAIKSIELAASVISEAIKEGRGEQEGKQEVEQKG